MFYTLLLILLVVLLFLGLIVLQEVGRRIGMRRAQRDPEGAHVGVGSVESAIFGLMGLMIGFTFFGAYQRFDQRRDLVVEETNRIRTAYLRLDFIPKERQPEMRQLFRQYVGARIEYYKSLTNEADAYEAMEAKELQNRVWQDAVSAAALPGAHPSAGMLFSALNDMNAITTTRRLAMQKHPPMIVFMMLIGISLAGALMAGYQMARSKQRNWLHIVGFAAVTAVVIYVILDMEYPRMGMIRMTAFDQAMVDLRNSMQ